MNNEPLIFPVIAFTHWEHRDNQQMYIADTPHSVRVNGKLKPKAGYADWEYTEHRDKAMPLSRYWWRRFRNHMHYCAHCAHWEKA